MPKKDSAKFFYLFDLEGFMGKMQSQHPIQYNKD